MEHGYRRTTVGQIADAAGVHIATVYELAGRKPDILRELIEEAISGADRPVPAEERDHVRRMLRTSDPHEKLQIYADGVTATNERVAPLLIALRDAADEHEEARKVWSEISDRRAGNMRRLIADLADSGGLRAGIDPDDAADTVWATNSAELYSMLRDQRGWSSDRYRRWLVDLWSRVLLE